MSEATYWIYAGSEPITNETDSVITDLDQARDSAPPLVEVEPR